MARTEIRSEQIGDSQVTRADINVSVAGKAVIAKAIQGSLISLSSTGADSGTGDVTFNMGFSATQRLAARNAAGAGVGEEVTLTQVLDWITNVRGSVLYRGASSWLALPPGISGQVLTSNGAGADPLYTTISGGAINKGTSVIDFGSGSSNTSTTVTGQSSIVSGSSILASIYPKDSVDHSLDEHLVEGIDIYAGNIVAGTGFTIYGVTRNFALRGQWNVSWIWS